MENQTMSNTERNRMPDITRREAIGKSIGLIAAIAAMPVLRARPDRTEIRRGDKVCYMGGSQDMTVVDILTLPIDAESNALVWWQRRPDLVEGWILPVAHLARVPGPRYMTSP